MSAAVLERRHLAASVGVVRARLEQLAQRKRGEAEDPQALATAEALLATVRSELAAPLLDAFAASFGLDGFERAVLLLCAGAELDPNWGALCAAAGDASRPYPHFALAFEAFDDPDWSALAPGATLRRWHIVECAGQSGFASDRLTLDERVLHHLLRSGSLDARLAGMVQPVPSPEAFADAPVRALAARFAQIWQGADRLIPAIAVERSDGALTKVVEACACLGLGVHRLSVDALPPSPGEQHLLAQLWAREAVLSHSVLFVEGDPPAERENVLARFLDALSGIVILASSAPPSGLLRAAVRIDLPSPGYDERLAIWCEALGPLAARLNGSVEAVATQFQLETPAIRAAGAEAAQVLGACESEAMDTALWDVTRRAARPRLDNLAQRIEAKADWDDLVLPAQQMAALRMIVAQTRRRRRVYDEWGFADKASRGLGMAALFAGPSGTGKTMAAEVLAGALALDLYRIDLSQIVNKYIGETEKNLRRVFDAADAGGAILLFDEADALFGRRSEVRDSHDRYANIEVGYLLQRLEAYRGLAILTTNMQQSIDAAFLRRLRFIVNFPFPDQKLRLKIWERAIPKRAPADAIDLAKLARLSLSGGSIRNMALGAAFLAADEPAPIGMRHMRQAAEAEYAKLDKPLGDSEIGGWA
jgi:ATPase family associated with various cellular activities (AAA)